MKNCDMVKDLIPLYKEDLLSDESKNFVENHIGDCKNCKSLFNDKDFDIDYDKAPLEFLKKRIQREKKYFAFAVLFLLISVGIFISYFLNKPIHFDDDGSLYDVYRTEDYFFVKFDDKVTKVSTYDAGDVIYLDSYTTRGDKYFKKNKFSKVISLSRENKKNVLYHNQDKMPTLVKGSGPIRQTLLPRLVLIYYFLISIGVFLALAIIIFLIDKSIQKIPGVLKIGILALPLSYTIATILVKGLSPATYYLEIDFKYIMLLTLGIYLFFLSITLFKRQRSMRKI